MNVDTQISKETRNGGVRVVDLTHTLENDSPYWPGDLPFHASVATTCQHDGYFVRNLSMGEHSGTHMDAPAHFDAGGLTVDQISVERFLAPGVVIDVSSAVKSTVDYQVTAQDIETWIETYGAIPESAVVFFRTGWAARWPSQENYMNADAEGVLHFPGLSIEAARCLLNRSRPAGIGIDTASIDCGLSKDCPVHQLTLSAGLFHLENVANLEHLPPSGFSIIALPLKLGGGSGAPARVLAFVPGHPEVRD